MQSFRVFLFLFNYLFPYWDKAMEEKLVKDFQLDVKKKISKLSKGMLSMVYI